MRTRRSNLGHAPAALATAAVAALLLTLAGSAAAGTAKRAAPAAASARAGRPTVDFSLYQELLNQHLWTTSDSGAPIETRFNYEKYYDERGRGERAFHIRRQFLAVDPARLDAKSRAAWAINFYNYLVLEQVTDYLLIASKKRQRYLSVQDIHPEGDDFFKHALVRIDTTSYSLDGFEHHFLFADFDRKPGSPRPADLDPRIHFALVCGAIGCPPLQPRAYRPDSLNLQLDRAVRQTLAHPHHVRRVPGTNAVQLSAIFYWYLSDFGGIREALKWALSYVPAETRAEIEQLKPGPMPSQIVWDWKLNQVVGWRFYDQMSKPIPGAAAHHDTS